MMTNEALRFIQTSFLLCIIISIIIISTIIYDLTNYIITSVEIINIIQYPYVGIYPPVLNLGCVYLYLI